MLDCTWVVKLAWGVSAAIRAIPCNTGNHVQARIFMNALIGGICDNTIVHNISNLFSTSIIVIVIYIESFYEEI